MKELIDQYEQALARASGREPGHAMIEATLFAFFELLPVPAWIKAVNEDGGLFMVRVNKAYENSVGISAEDYQAKSDSELFSDTHAVQFEENDMRAIRSGKPIYVVENDLDASGQPREWLVWKWPVTVEGSAIAVCGIAMRRGEYV